MRTWLNSVLSAMTLSEWWTRTYERRLEVLLPLRYPEDTSQILMDSEHLKFYHSSSSSDSLQFKSKVRVDSSMGKTPVCSSLRL